MDAVQLDMFAEDPNNRPMLLSALGEGVQNACGVYTENVLEFREGLLPHNYVCVSLCAVDDFIIYEFTYMVGTYGCGHPLCSDSHKCHRKNDSAFLAQMICNVFQFGVVPYDGNLRNYPKETKELLKLCRKLCDRIAKEVA